MSRGITKEEAERLIIYGFLAPVVSEIPIESVEEQLQRLWKGSWDNEYLQRYVNFFRFCSKK